MSRAAAVRELIAGTAADTATALRAWHPTWTARYLWARAFRRRIGRCVPDGEPLTRAEMRALLGVIDCSRDTAGGERIRL